ncbi:MAG: hypothetical protein K9G58_03005 [Bacteroidales bacterium]|nr:hypothetical protein [Bacteroidales bacterium]MCF8387843.1 hypothetical protein [Bacteroidales bacterium]MCF8397109.1 hypothetical protein [Bacteroidales bacterium]
MRNKTDKKPGINFSAYALILMAASLLILSMDSCKKITKPENYENHVIEYDLINTRISIKFIDAATGELIGRDGNLSVNIRFSGKDALKVVDISGLSKNVYKSMHGFFTFGVAPGEMPGPEDPFRFHLTASVEGYFNSGKTFRISKEGNYFYELRMMDLANLPEGVSKREEQVFANSSGVVTEQKSIITPNNRSTLLIPEACLFKDKNGQVLTGTLMISLIHFSNVSEACLMAYPGGLQAISLSEDGRANDLMFFPAGLNSVYIQDAAGKVAKTIEGELPLLSMNIPAQTSYFKEETGQYENISNVDEIPLWFFENETGSWVQDTSSKVGVTGPGIYRVSSQIDHLSWFSWNWATERNFCSQAFKTKFIGNQSECDCYWVEIEMRNPHTSAFLMKKWMYVCDEKVHSLYDLPGGIPFEIRYNGYCNDRTSTEPEYQYSGLCNQESLEVTWQDHDPGAGVSVQVLAHCPNEPGIEIHPDYGVWYRKANDWCWKWISTQQGQAEICGLELGRDYIMAFVYHDYYKEFVFTPQYDAYVYQDISLTDEVCSEIFGL